MNQSPLYEIHKSIGAEFYEIHGWDVPSHYGDPAEEHLRVRRYAGIMDLTHRGKILISGKDRTKFLQNILSQDINALTPGTGAHAALLNTKGHMLAYMRIFSDDDSFLIDTETGEADKIIQILNRYLFREDVKIEDVTMKYGLVTVQGPNSGNIICRISGDDIKKMNECSLLNLTFNGIQCKIVRTTFTGEYGCTIYIPRDFLRNIWDEILISPPSVAGSSDKMTPFGHDAFNSLRIEAGIPLYSVDMDEETIPIEANLDQAISYTKGCYIGQETIARIKYKGHVNRTMTGFLIEGNIIPVKGDRIYNTPDNTGHNIGFITSSCLSPSLKRIISLGYLKTGYNESGNKVIIKKDSGTISAAVTKLPFHKQ